MPLKRSRPDPRPDIAAELVWLDDVLTIQRVLGKGTYGTVLQAKHKETGELVALKQIVFAERFEKETRGGQEGLPLTSIRELSILKKLSHENIVKIKFLCCKEIFTEDGQAPATCQRFEFYMALPCMQHDLAGLIQAHGSKFPPSQVKRYLQQTTRGIHYLHKNNVIHRDLKPANILLNNQGNLVLTDFGLARSFKESNRKYTPNVVTRFYRAPEIQFGDTDYTEAIDMWSVGCIFGELLIGHPLFTAADELSHLKIIFQLTGNPTEENWPGWKEFPLNRNGNFQLIGGVRRKIEATFSDRTTGLGVDLIDKLLLLNPATRLTAKQVLSHAYFWTDPLPMSVEDLPKYESALEYWSANTTQRREQQEKYQRRETAPLPSKPVSAQHPGARPLLRYDE